MNAVVTADGTHRFTEDFLHVLYTVRILWQNPRLLAEPAELLVPTPHGKSWILKKKLENLFGPGKSWKLKLKVVESRGKISLKAVHCC